MDRSLTSRHQQGPSEIAEEVRQAALVGIRRGHYITVSFEMTLDPKCLHAVVSQAQADYPDVCFHVDRKSRKVRISRFGRGVDPGTPWLRALAGEAPFLDMS